MWSRPLFGQTSQAMAIEEIAVFDNSVISKQKSVKSCNGTPCFAKKVKHQF